MRIDKRRHGLRAAGSGMAGLLMFGSVTSPAADADTAPETPASDVSARPMIEEIVVTARRKEESQQDVPVAVTALSGDFLDEQAIMRIDEISRFVPSLHIDTYNTPTTTNIGVRGVRSANIAPGQDAAAGFYFGEVNYAYTIGIGQLLFDMQSVEVLKGPQGTLFGRNSTAGAVLAAPARPTQDFDASVNLGSTVFDGGMGLQSTDVLNLPLSDSFRLRLAVRVVDRDGYVENTGTPATTQSGGPFGDTGFDAFNDEESRAWRLSAIWTPADSVESYFLYQGSRLRTLGTGFTINALNPQLFGPVFPPYDRRRAEIARNFWSAETETATSNAVDTQTFSNATTWDLSDTLKLKNIAGYRRYELNDTSDFDGLAIEVIAARLFDDGHEWSEELQLQGSSFGKALEWVAGLYYSEQVIEHGSDSSFYRLVYNIDRSEHDNTSYAAFAQGTWHFASVEGLSLTAGMRLTRDERAMDIVQTSNNGLGPAQTCALVSDQGVPLDPCGLSGERSFTEPTYTLTVDYKADGDTLVYAAHRRGYRTGGLSYTAHSPGTLDFKPEYVSDIELGLKKDWHLGDALLRSNLAVFHQDYKDIQRFSSPPDQPQFFTVVNAGSAKISGGELELTFVPFNHLELRGSYALVLAEYDEFVTGEGDFTDNEFAQTPEHQYSLGARYRLPVAAELGELSLQADYAYQSHVFYTDTTQGDETTYGPHSSQGQEAYGLLNLGVNWNRILESAFDVALYVKNATEEETRPFGVQLYGSLGTNASTIGDPRIFGAELTYRFGD